METVKPIVQEIRIQNQVIVLDPPIDYARATWVKQLRDWLGTLFSDHFVGLFDECLRRCCVSSTSHAKLSI